MLKYSIVFEDDCLLVVDKSSGLLVIPTPKGEKNTLTDLLNNYLAVKYPEQNIKAHPCHRLDRETSGLILYAKGKAMQQKVMDQFHNKQVGKKYLAFAQDYKVKAKRLMLHSSFISLIHPGTNEPVNFSSHLPEDMLTLS